MEKLLKIVMMLLLSAFLFGCGASEEPYVIKIGSETVGVPEFRFYFLLSRLAYEEEGGADIWLTTINGVKAEDVAKERTFESVARVKISNIQAGSLGISITEEDTKSAADMVSHYKNSIPAGDLAEIDISDEQLQNIMEETVIYGRVFNEVTGNVQISEKDFNIFFENYIKDSANDVKMDDDLIELSETLRALYTEKTKNDVFAEQYAKWEADTKIEKNQELWESITVLRQ